MPNARRFISVFLRLVNISSVLFDLTNLTRFQAQADTSFVSPVQLCQAPGGLVSGVYQKPSSNLVGAEDHDEITCSAKTGISKLQKQKNCTELELATSLPMVGQ